MFGDALASEEPRVQANPRHSPVRVWVRREDGEAQLYALRFDCDQGRALVRVLRGGVLVDAPATSRSVEPALSAEQLRTAVLVHVGPDRERSTFLFERLDEEDLAELPGVGWNELRCAHEEARWSCELRRAPAPRPAPGPVTDAQLPEIALPAPSALSASSAELAATVAQLQADLEAEQARCRALMERLADMETERTLVGRG